MLPQITGDDYDQFLLIEDWAMSGRVIVYCYDTSDLVEYTRNYYWLDANEYRNLLEMKSPFREEVLSAPVVLQELVSAPLFGEE